MVCVRWFTAVKYVSISVLKIKVEFKVFYASKGLTFSKMCITIPLKIYSPNPITIRDHASEIFSKFGL